MNNQTCFESSLSCNCDAKVPEWLSDEGIISNKDLLPITEFAYGPIQYDMRQANIEIGSLKCSGIKKSNNFDKKILLNLFFVLRI